MLRRGGNCEASYQFCGSNETTSHLFFSCPLARYIWNVVSCALGIRCQFTDAEHCLNTWLKPFTGSKCGIVSVGVAGVMWGNWKARNLAYFRNKWPSDPGAR